MLNQYNLNNLFSFLLGIIMSFKIQNTTDKKNNDGISLMIYGKSGVGKTSLVNTLDPKSTLVINIENGIACLNKGIDYIDINTISEIEELPMFMAQAKYSTIVIDSLSYLTEIYLMHYPKTKNRFESYQELQRVVNVLVYNILQLVKLKKNIICIQKRGRQASLGLLTISCKNQCLICLTTLCK